MAVLVTVTERAALVPVGGCMDEESVQNNHSDLKRNTVMHATALCSVEIQSHKAKSWRLAGGSNESYLLFDGYQILIWEGGRWLWVEQ